MRRFLLLLGIVVLQSADPLAQSAAFDEAEVRAFLAGHSLEVVVDPGELARREAAAVAARDEFVEYLHESGEWETLTEAERADYLAGFQTVFPTEVMEFIPGIGILTFNTGSFGSPRLDAIGWNVESGDERLYLVIGDGDSDRQRGEVSFFDGRRIDVTFGEDGEEMVLALAARDLPAGASGASPAGVWTLRQIAQHSLESLPRVVYRFADDGAFGVELADPVDGLEIIGELPAGGLWAQSTGLASITDWETEEIASGRVLVLHNPEMETQLFIVEQLTDDQMVLRLVGLFDQPVLYLGR